MATLTAVGGGPAVDLSDMIRPRRTEAMPKHSLFGSSLENYDKEELSRIQKLEAGSNVPNEYKSPGRFYLPDSQRSKMKGLLFTRNTYNKHLPT